MTIAFQLFFNAVGNVLRMFHVDQEKISLMYPVMSPVIPSSPSSSHCCHFLRTNTNVALKVQWE